MYSQYMDGKFNPLTEQPRPHSGQPPHKQTQKSSAHHGGGLLGEVTGGLSQTFGKFLKQFSGETLDTGDILLVLIILFLFLEGDNLELVITLGLMLLLGLNDD